MLGGVGSRRSVLVKVVDTARHEKFSGLFIKQRAGVGDWAIGGSHCVRFMYVWSFCKTVWRRRFVHEEGGGSRQGLTVGNV